MNQYSLDDTQMETWKKKHAKFYYNNVLIVQIAKLPSTEPLICSHNTLHDLTQKHNGICTMFLFWVCKCTVSENVN